MLTNSILGKGLHTTFITHFPRWNEGSHDGIMELEVPASVSTAQGTVFRL